MTLLVVDLSRNPLKEKLWILPKEFVAILLQEFVNFSAAAFENLSDVVHFNVQNLDINLEKMLYDHIELYNTKTYLDVVTFSQGIVFKTWNSAPSMSNEK